MSIEFDLVDRVLSDMRGDTAESKLIVDFDAWRVCMRLRLSMGCVGSGCGEFASKGAGPDGDDTDDADGLNNGDGVGAV